MPEMEKIVNNIAEKLGVKLAFYAESLPKKDVPFCDKTFEGVTDDGNYTFFRFLYKNVGYIGVLEGVTETQRNYATLLPSYIESFAEKEAELSKTDYLSECAAVKLKLDYIKKDSGVNLHSVF